MTDICCGGSRGKRTRQKGQEVRRGGLRPRTAQGGIGVVRRFAGLLHSTRFACLATRPPLNTALRRHDWLPCVPVCRSAVTTPGPAYPSAGLPWSPSRLPVGPDPGGGGPRPHCSWWTWGTRHGTWTRQGSGKHQAPLHRARRPRGPPRQPCCLARVKQGPRRGALAPNAVDASVADACVAVHLLTHTGGHTGARHPTHRSAGSSRQPPRCQGACTCREGGANGGGVRACPATLHTPPILVKMSYSNP